MKGPPAYVENLYMRFAREYALRSRRLPMLIFLQLNLHLKI